jgi:hypothetical protein
LPDLDESKHSIELARGGENLPQKVVNFGQLFNELGVQIPKNWHLHGRRRGTAGLRQFLGTRFDLHQ